jgi:hypothetical protein
MTISDDILWITSRLPYFIFSANRLLFLMAVDIITFKLIRST